MVKIDKRCRSHQRRKRALQAVTQRACLIDASRPSAEAAAKPINPTRNILRRPPKSAIRPPRSSSPPKAKVSP